MSSLSLVRSKRSILPPTYGFILALPAGWQNLRVLVRARIMPCEVKGVFEQTTK